jgi:hypothetical protein
MPSLCSTSYNLIHAIDRRTNARATSATRRRARPSVAVLLAAPFPAQNSATRRARRSILRTSALAAATAAAAGICGTVASSGS